MSSCAVSFPSPRLREAALRLPHYLISRLQATRLQLGNVISVSVHAGDSLDCHLSPTWERQDADSWGGQASGVLLCWSWSAYTQGQVIGHICVSCWSGVGNVGHAGGTLLFPLGSSPIKLMEGRKRFHQQEAGGECQICRRQGRSHSIPAFDFPNTNFL